MQTSPKSWEIFDLLLNWERPGHGVKPSGHIYEKTDLNTKSTPYFSYLYVRVSTHLSSDSYRWQCGTENPQWSLSLKWKILWQLHRKKTFQFEVDFFFNHETGKPLAEIHRATEFAREMKMFACREVWKEEEEIKAKCSGVRNIGVLVGELW